MKLGTETGSLVNHMYSSVKSTMPEVGMPATLLSWTDRTPATVVEVFKKGKFVYFTVQEDNYERIDSLGMSDQQDYEYSRNLNGCTYTFRLEKSGYVRVYKNPETGRYCKTSGNVLLGKRERYCDFSF